MNLINIKYRDGRKNFKLVKGAEKVFYNIDRTIDHDYIVIVEGEMDTLIFCGKRRLTSVVSVPNGATINNVLTLITWIAALIISNDKRKNHHSQLMQMRQDSHFTARAY